MVLKFFLPRLHRKNMTSNHTFCCRPTGVFGFRATLQYICFRSSGSIGGVWSTLASPFLFISTVTTWNTSLALLKNGSCIISIPSSREKFLLSTKRNTFKCRKFVRCTVLFSDIYVKVSQYLCQLLRWTVTQIHMSASIMYASVLAVRL